MDTNHLKGYKFWESEYFRIRRRAYGYTLLTLSGLLLLWWQVGNLVENRLRNQTREQVAAEVSSYGSALTQSINRRLSVINGLSVFVETEMSHHEELGEEELTLFVAGLYRNTDGILNIALAPDGIMQFVYPYEKNKSVLGYEPSQDERSNVRNDVQRAKDTQRIIVSLPIELIQGGKGIIARQAVFIGDRYWGLSNIVINVELILEDAGMISVQNDLELALRDQSDEIFFGSEGIFDAGPVIYTIFLPEGTWQLAGIPTGGWEARYQSELWFYRILSLIVVGTLTLLTYQYSRRRDRLKLLVKHRTRDLQEIESKYRNLVDNSLVGIYITQNHHIKFANEGLADLFGYKSAGELIGIHVQKLVTSQSWEVVQKEVQLWESGQKKSSNYRFKGLRKDGNTLDIEALGVITKYQGQPALQGVLIDITERVRAEERFKGLSEASFEAIFISEKGICLEANLAAEKLFGYSQEEAVGMSGSDIFVLEDRNRVIANLLSGYEDPYQARALRKDGSTFIAEVHGKTMYYKGRAVRVTSIRDISKRVQVEEEYRNLFNSVPVGIYSSTPDGRFLDGNPALLKILGYPNNETMFASDVNDLFITRTDREDELGLIEQEGSVINHILQLRRYDGEIIWVQDVRPQTFRTHT
jgi:PAS domain S-box-containing protein